MAFLMLPKRIVCTFQPQNDTKLWMFEQSLGNILPLCLLLIKICQKNPFRPASQKALKYKIQESGLLKGLIWPELLEAELPQCNKQWEHSL